MMLALLCAGCTSGAPLGSTCEASGECLPDLQCLNTVCVPRCIQNVECGDGFLCSASGECEVVISELGDPCRRESDCGPRLACLLEEVDQDNDGFLDGTCAPENAGYNMGNGCKQNNDCRNGICVGGLCTQLCVDNRDCPLPFECAIILLDPVTAKKFRGCYPGEIP